ncbi:MAG TPA: RdgB/HAM1 family non-canonical purine NTP pyrophosphatase, partial [Anaerolineaceae bacterium]|nr:RdgB/HAM1 family non-canonical purine NTP pyrophosphatase [Anaerolineaceae bacterium]
MKTLLIATNNPGKIAEISAILAPLPLKLITPAELGLTLSIPEDGQSYFENAHKKAAAFAQVSKLPTLADDSGLEVEVLGGAPGVHSHRYLADPSATDEQRCRALLNQLSAYPRPWKAAFQCEIVLCNPNEIVLRSHGSCPGEIIPEFRGKNGFGYDPIFLVEGTHQTMAELTDEQKNRISHRAKALQAAW